MTRVYLAGHRGMVGGAILRRLEARGADGEEIELITATHAALDLTDQAAVRAFMAADDIESAQRHALLREHGMEHL